MTDQQRIAEITARCEEGRPIRRIDVKYLLAQLAGRDKEIERLREAQRWIPVSERLPDNLCVLAIGKDLNPWGNGYGIAWYPHRWPEEITHWMALPVGPEVKGEAK